jgi:triosephosphate isomerase (TIM)
MTVTVGVSLKMYFGPRRAGEWFGQVAELARGHQAVASGAVELFVIPSFTAIPAALAAFDGSRVVIGAQNLFWEDEGAFTGEVSGSELAELGVGVVEVGHAERRRLFGETDAVVARKAAAALRNGLSPVLCIGETARMSSADAAAACRAQLTAAVLEAPGGRLIVAYEPVWAIGVELPAPLDHIAAVCAELRSAVSELPHRAGSSVIYGGSAGPGLLSALGGGVDGIFLGRFAHHPAALAAVLDEAGALA